MNHHGWCEYPTIGVDEEFHLIDPVTGELVSKATEFLSSLEEPLKTRCCYELFQCIIECRTDPHKTVDELLLQIKLGREELAVKAHECGALLAAGGTHPFSSWKDQLFIESEHYKWVRDEYELIAHRMLSMGLHVHVGVSSSECAMYVIHQMKRWAYPLLALSCNSPFFDGIDFRHQSTRQHLFHALPRTSFAPDFETLEEYEAFYDKLLECGDVHGMSDMWWMIRPKKEFGTVEYRIFDLPTDVNRIAAIVALVQAATFFYQKEFYSGRSDYAYVQMYLDENEWKAARDGLAARILEPVTGDVTTCRNQLLELVELVSPVAVELGSAFYLEKVLEFIHLGTESDYLKSVYQKNGGDLRSLEMNIAQRTVLYESIHMS